MDIDKFFKGGQKPSKKYQKPVSILEEAILDAALLFKNHEGEKNKDICLMLSETARLLVNDPIKLTQIFENLNSKSKELQVISRILNDKNSSWSPTGISPEGYTEISNLSHVMISSPEGVGDALGGIPANAIYSMGVQLYFIVLAILDDNMFNYFKKCYEI